MNKKFILLAAFAAVAAVFTSCSSENDITETTVPEQPTVVSGDPITFTATMNDDGTTRATAASVLKGFTLWGVQGTSAAAPAIDGLAYSYDSDGKVWKSDDAPAYDDPENKGNYFFYAMALGDSDTPANAKAITFGDDGTSSNTAGSINIKGTDGNNDALLASESTKYDQKRFTYTMPYSGNYLTLADQEDLLVAHNFGDENSGFAEGTVPLTFDHALANIELNIAMQLKSWTTEGGANQYDWVNETVPSSGVFAVIKSITIHGLKRTGTYTFGAGWGNPTGAGEIKIEYQQGLFVYGACYQTPGTDSEAASYTANPTLRRTYEKTFYTPLATGDKSIMVVPQTFTTWDPTASIEDSSSDCYIEIEGEIFYDTESGNANDDGWEDKNKTLIENFIHGWTIFGGENSVEWENSDVSVSLTPLTDISEGATSFSKYYIPFKTNNNKLDPNKKYSFWIDLFNLRYDNGDGAVSGVNVN